MFLQYFKKKENEYKEDADLIYTEILNRTKNILKKNFFETVDFDSTFETICILLIFHIKNLNLSHTNVSEKIKEELLKNFVNDLDKSIRDIGISDMSIGKYVKKYVKKFYYRVKILDPILQENTYNNFLDYLSSIKSVNIKNIENFKDELTNILNDIKKTNK